jgi:hypothetical protein
MTRAGLQPAAGPRAERAAAPGSPAVSVIIPARNEERRLVRLLDSLRRLEVPAGGLEILVADHASSDGTAAVARRAGARVVQPTGRTIAAVRNAAARAATAPILAFVDADCTVAPDWLSRALPYFTDARVGAVGSYYAIPADPASWVRPVLQLQAAGLPDRGPAAWLPAGNFIVRRDVFWAAGGFDETLMTCEDVDLCQRIARTHQVLTDKRIRCLHHGEPRTLGELFRKELWRGRDNIRGLFRHGVSLRELPSVLLPPAFLLAGPAAAAAALLGFGPAALAILLLGALLPAAIAGVICRRVRLLRPFPAVLAVAACYLTARGLAPARAWRHLKETA